MVGQWEMGGVEENGVKGYARGRRNDSFQIKMRTREVIKHRGGERKGGKSRMC